jgi:DNA-directed RNA polymerase subunit K/omega
MNAYELAVLSGLRAHQLMAGSVPRLAGVHKATTMARMEVAAGKVVRLLTAEVRGGVGSPATGSNPTLPPAFTLL